MCSSSGRPLPLSAGWVLALGTRGLLQSWVYLQGSSSVLSQPVLGTCQWFLSARGGESWDSPSGSGTQTGVGPHSKLTLGPFITLLLPPQGEEQWGGVCLARILCYVQLGYFVFFVFCIFVWHVPVSLQRVTVLPWSGCTPACLCYPVGVQDSGLPTEVSESLKHLGSPGLWLVSVWMWLWAGASWAVRSCPQGPKKIAASLWLTV